jgi:hypothetical protein
LQRGNKLPQHKPVLQDSKLIRILGSLLNHLNGDNTFAHPLHSLTSTHTLLHNHYPDLSLQQRSNSNKLMELLAHF